MSAVALKKEEPVVAAPPKAQQEEVVMPGLRRDLVTTQQMYEGRTYYVVKDPISLQYFRMTSEDFTLASLFDGQRTFGQIRDQYAQLFPHVRLEYSPEDLNERVLRFANDLALMRFLSVQGQRLKAQYDAAKTAKKKKNTLYEMANKVFFFRKSVYDPDKLFGRMAKPIGWVWTNATLWASYILIALATIVFLNHLERLDHAFANLFSINNIAVMWVTTIVIKSIHELGHGLTCKHFGGEVHEVGVMCMVFTPYFFVNVSDAWNMPDRRHRILISAAGIFVELVFGALAVFLWAIAQPGWLRDFLFNVIFICTISTVIFNANPLMRFDGYYILTDLMEVPNLQSKSRAVIGNIVKKFLFGAKSDDAAMARMPLPKKRLWLFYIYAVLSWVYGYYVIWSLTVYMAPHLEPLGIQGLAEWFSTFALLAWIIMPFIAFFKSLDIKPEDWQRGGRMRRLANMGGTIVALFVAFCFVPVPLHIKRGGAVTLAEPEQVRPEVGGFVKTVFVKDGDRVQPGQALFELSNRDVEQHHAVAAIRLQAAEAELQKAFGLERPSEVRQLEDIKSALQSRLTEAKHDVELLTVRARDGGIILTPHLDHLPGRLVKNSEMLCEVGKLNPLRIRVALSEKQVRWVKKGNPVELKVAAFPDRTFRGQVADDPVMAYLGEIPKGFAVSYGGDVPSYPDAEGREIPTERTFEAVVEIPNPGEALRPGMSARGKIDTGRYPWGRLVFQSLLDLVSLDYRF